MDLSSANTLQLRSQAEHYAELREVKDLHDLLSHAQTRSMKWHLLGGGSNLVLPAVVSGLVIKIRNLGKGLVHEDAEAWFVKAQAGENWHEFVQYTLQQGYWGLENLALIPGTVGAAPIQNIGAYGLEVKDLLWQVTTLDLHSGQSRVFSNAECHFAYRDSYFKQEGAGKYVIWDVTFRLPKKNTLRLEYGDVKKEIERAGETPSPRSLANAVIRIRQSKLPDPQVIGNAGSFFKNPIVSSEVRNRLLDTYPDLVNHPYGDAEFKLAAGWLIDRAGWKGKSMGPVGMYEKQALVLVNHGGAVADDVWRLAQQVISDVRQKFGVDIEPEPIRW